jgi:hypothetical protein
MEKGPKTMDDRDRMERRAPWIPWAITSLALVAVAVIAYGLGAQREAGTFTTEPVHWHGSGFGGIWLFFLLFWVFGGLRWMWWGGRGYGPWHYGRRYRRYYYDDHDDWEEWHRREHERIDRSNGPRSPAPSGSNQGPIT